MVREMPVIGRHITSGKRMLCVGRGEQCFACGGRGRLYPVGRRVGMTLVASRCPVCRGSRAGKDRGVGRRQMSRFTVEDIPLGYAPVPPEMLLYRPKLKDADVRVWCAFAMHRNLKTGRTSAGVVRIAEILDVDRSTVTRAIARLIEAGFLLRRHQRREEESGKFSDAEYTSGRRRRTRATRPRA